MEMRFRTDLNCGSCIAKVKPFLDAETSIQRWSVDTRDPAKVLTVEGQRPDAEGLAQALGRAGFHLLGPAETVPAPRPATAETYRPLILIFVYLSSAVALSQYATGAWDAGRAMAQFMGGFFLVFSFFKLLDPGKFADAYATYDLLARRWRAYGLAYPFLELALGTCYLGGFFPTVTNVLTAALMALGTVGVAQALSRGQRLECACLGTVFNLPMTKVTLFEDLLMLGMALVALLRP